MAATASPLPAGAAGRTTPPKTLHALVADNLVLGAVEGGRWIDGTTAAPRIRPARYAVLDVNGSLGVRSGPAVTPAEEPPSCEHQFEVRIGGAASRPEPTVIGVAAPTWPLYPRKVERLDRNGAVYTGIAADFLRTKGIANPTVAITALVRADLDADGRLDVVMAATHRPRGEGNRGSFPGEYSFVLVRRGTPGGVQSILV